MSSVLISPFGWLGVKLLTLGGCFAQALTLEVARPNDLGEMRQKSTNNATTVACPAFAAQRLAYQATHWRRQFPAA